MEKSNKSHADYNSRYFQKSLHHGPAEPVCFE